MQPKMNVELLTRLDQQRSGSRSRCGVFGSLSSGVVFAVFFLGPYVVPPCAAFGPTYVFISSPTSKLIYYSKLPGAMEAARREIPVLKTFCDSGCGFLQPTGIAAYNTGKVLLVADPLASAIYGVPIFNGAEEGKLVAGKPMPVATGVSSRWVTVDGQGSIFYMDANLNAVLKLDGKSVLAMVAGDTGKAEQPQTLYSVNGPPAIPAVNKPRAIVADNFYLYWVNGNNGYNDGTVLRGMETPADLHRELEIRALALNAAAADGICLASTNLFYTADGKVYGMKRGGGTVTVITDKLVAPAGCAWDGDGSVYVADSDEGKVYSFAGNTPNLYPRGVIHEMDVKGATGVSVYMSSSAMLSRAGRSWIAVCLLIGLQIYLATGLPSN